MKYWIDGCTSKKCQVRGRLAISHFRGAVFYFLMSLLLFVFLLFAGYGIWGVVLHEMLALKSNAVVEHCFLGFFCLVMHDLLRGEKKVLGEGKR
jgi:hypothetical protein